MEAPQSDVNAMAFWILESTDGSLKKAARIKTMDTERKKAKDML